MKKLNLLAPYEHNVFLRGRGREKVRYLQIPSFLDRNKLEEDLKNGALYFENVKKQTDRRPSKTVVIRADNEENGLMAVTYLAAAYNQTDDSDAGEYDDDDDLLTEADDDYFEAEDLTAEEYVGDDGEENPGPEDAEEWLESKYRLPLLDIEEIKRVWGHEDASIFISNGFGMQGQNNEREKTPWWFACKEEPVCIVVKSAFYSAFGGFGGNVYDRFSTEVAAHFPNNRHIYILEIKSKDAGLFEGTFDDDIFPEGNVSNEDPSFTQMVLDQAAAVIDINSRWDKKKEAAYRREQFENWVAEEGFSLSGDFPTARIVQRITGMKNPAKSMLMKRIINYIREQGDPGVELREEDFDILKKFANIMEKKSLDDALSVKKLERELYGMEDVKRQVQEIVDVMKYYKRRETVGLGKGSFHNVHLLIGAPGTAKTTVAKLMGNMMMEQNLLPGNRFTCVNGADLKGMFVGHTAPKVHRIFENNDIIMIDEAYSLVARDGWDRGGDGFSQEAVAALITEIEEHGPEKLVLFAGYGGIDVDDKDNLMKGFIDSNPGLKSRINSTIFFKSYTPDEMVEIVHILARTQQFSLTKSADEDLRAYFAERVRDRNFGNGREARSLLQNATIFAAKRTRDIKAVRTARNRLQAITASDIRQAIQRQRRSTAMQNGRQSAGGFGFMV